VVLASKGGAPAHPDWYHNLVAHPEVIVEVGAERFSARATTAQGEERERLFNQHAAAMPYFRGFQEKTQRQIPVVILGRIR
jgi:deazaflavin-dependent oxidoreductase (nitroreductase family)